MVGRQGGDRKQDSHLIGENKSILVAFLGLGNSVRTLLEYRLVFLVSSNDCHFFYIDIPFIHRHLIPKRPLCTSTVNGALIDESRVDLWLHVRLANVLVFKHFIPEGSLPDTRVPLYLCIRGAQTVETHLPEERTVSSRANLRHINTLNIFSLEFFFSRFC